MGGIFKVIPKLDLSWLFLLNITDIQSKNMTKMEKIQICVKMCCDLAKSKPLNCLCLSFPSYCLIFVMSEVTFLQEMRAIKGIDYSFLRVKKMQ